MKNLTELLEKIHESVSKLKESDKIFILHHDDADGCSSAAMFSIIIQNLIDKPPDELIATKPRDYRLKELKQGSPNYVFVLDVPLSPENLSMFDGFVLDHHVIENQKSSQNMLYINPREFIKEDEKVPPTSYMVYKLLKQMFPEEKVSWIAGIGITEDHRVEICKEVFEDVKKEYPTLFRGGINQFELERSVFGEMWDMVRSGKMTRESEGAKTAVLALMECKDRPDKFLNGLTQHSGVLKRFYDKVMYYIEDSIRDAEQNAKFHSEKKVMFYETKRMRMSGSTSFISDKLRQQFPERIICVIHKHSLDGRVKVSVRLEQSKIDVDLIEVLNKIKEKISSLKGGGHKSAVGAEMRIDDLEKFKEEFLASI